MTHDQAVLGASVRVPSSTALNAGIGGLLLVLLVVASLGLRAGNSLSLALPAAAGVLALILLVHRPLAYLTLVFWCWLLVPEIRRLIDEQAGWSPSNPVMLTPYVVTLVSAVTLLHRPHLLRQRHMLPVTLALGGVCIGFLVGVARAGPLPAVYGLMEWGCPLVLAFSIVAIRVPLERLVRTIWRLSAAGCIVLGAYGLIQFFWLPSWDAFWMTNAPINSIGSPEPLKVRVFSALNSPGPLAAVLVTLLLLLALRSGPLKAPAILLGSLALALSLVRAGWLAIAFGVIVLVLSNRARSSRSTLRSLIVVVPLIVLLTQGGPISSVISTRAASIGDVSQDVSFTARVGLYRSFTPRALTDPVGKGIGSTGAATRLSNDEGALGTFGNFDSGLLELPFVLGWIGAALFIVGVARAVIDGFRVAVADPRIRAAVNAVAVAAVTGMLFVNVLKGVSGVFIWIALAIGIRARAEAPSPERRLRVATAHRTGG